MNYLAVLLLGVFFAGVAMTVNEGLWSNTVSLFSIMFASLMAWYWGPVLGEYILEQVEPKPEYEWAFWFASIWGVFFFAVTIMRIIADKSSRTRMRFVKPLEMAGGILMGLLVATMFSSFTAYSMFVPFKASAWKVSDGAPWAQQTITTLARPMFNVGKAVYGADFPDLSQ